MNLIGKRYELLRKLGSGSLGDVHLARDRREAREVCLKLLQKVNPDSTRNLIDEFKFLSQLEHPNLIKVYDFGFDEESGAFFALEYAPNGNLGSRLPLGKEDFFAAASAICQALEFIHGRGVVHGDLKPANILVDADENCRLSDFGLSIIFGEQNKPRSAGSALYIAPEVLRNEGISMRSDIYALGLLFYEMMTGVAAYDGNTSDIFSKKLRGEITIGRVPAEFGGEKMAQIIRKMTIPEPSLRYQSIEQVRRDLVESGLSGDSRAGATVLGKAKFVGRKEELAWLDSGLENWNRGENTTRFIAGESGIGKSWLVDEFRVNLQIKGNKFFIVHCREDDVKPFSPLLTLLNYLFDEFDPKLEKFASYGPDLRRLFPARFEDEPQREFSEAEIKSGRRRMLDNLLQYFGDLSTSGKAIFAIEDLQWADSDTLDFLKLAFDSCGLNRDRALFLICTGQTQANETDLPVKPSNPDNFRMLAGPDNETWEAFLTGLLGGSDWPAEFSSKLFSETGGNFLFTTEVIKEMLESKVLRKVAGAWQLEPEWADQIGVPRGIKSIIARRLNRLPEDGKKISNMAAVLGRSFLSEEIIGLGISGPESRFDELIRQGVFRRFTMGGHDRLDFIHGQLRRAAYDQLSEDERKKYHLTVANYFERSGAEPEFLGQHYLLAGRCDKALGFLNQSAFNAERIYAYQKASHFYSQTIECIEKQPDGLEKNDKLYAAYLGLGKTLDFFSPAEAAKPLQQAILLAESASQERLAESSILAGNNYVHTGENEKAVPILERGLRAAQKANHHKLLGEAYTGLGFVQDKLGYLDEAEKSYLKALNALSEIDFPEGSCRVLNYIGIIRKRQGDFNGALDFYRRALEISVQQHFLWSAMNLYGNLGNLHISRGDPKSGLEYYLESLRIAEEISDRRIEGINLLNIGHTYSELGNLEQAENYFYQAIHKLREIGDKGSEAITLNNLGLLFYRKGEINKSIEHYRKGLELAREINQPRAELANHIGLAEDFTAIASFEKARLEAEHAREMAKSINDIEQLAAALSILAELKFETGTLEGAKSDVEEFLGLSEQVGEPAQRAKVLLIGEACGIADLQFGQIANDPKSAGIVTRFRAGQALRKKEKPEIWIARLDEALRRSQQSPGEYWRLNSLKIKFLKLLDEKFEREREIDRLTGDISRRLAGLGPKAISGLAQFLQIEEKGIETSMDQMQSMSGASREERLEVLFRVARTINTIRELDPLLNKIMDLALETLGGERGFIMLFSGSENGVEKSLEPRAARNLAREDILGETTISHSSAMEVALSGKPLLLGRSEDNIDPRQSMVTFRISSVLCAPLAVKGEVLGIVYVDSRSGKTFSKDDLDFLVSFADLAAIAIENASLAERLSKKNIYLQKQVESIWGFGNIVGRSAAMQKVFRMAESVAETDVTVVITGESGTGKELLARAIHFASSRKKGLFMPVDCGAMAETLLESELFGYIKGAFTGAVSDREGLFEAAEGGTVFLDEISNTSKNFQAKLLRVLQEGEIRRVGDNRTRKVDVRIIAATNKDIEQEMKADKFREDLYYRLNVVNINLPPLRDRPEDIPILAGYFLDKICGKMKVQPKIFSPQALDTLLAYSWPGNVRQLENLCERAIIFSKGDIIELEALPAEIRAFISGSSASSATVAVPKTKAELKSEKARMDRLFLLELLTRTEGNVMEASRLSGMDRSQIHHLMSRFGMSSTDFKKSA